MRKPTGIKTDEFHLYGVYRPFPFKPSSSSLEILEFVEGNLFFISKF